MRVGVAFGRHAAEIHEALLQRIGIEADIVLPDADAEKYDLVLAVDDEIVPDFLPRPPRLRFFAPCSVSDPPSTSIWKFLPATVTFQTPSSFSSSTSNSSPSTLTLRVGIRAPPHGCLIGDYVTISSVSADVGGITQANLQNEFEILTAVDDNTYTIESPAAATSTATGSTADARSSSQSKTRAG